VITAQQLPQERHGFHYTAAGRPFALIQYCEAWSLAASHELIEMLCDPYGVRTVFGPSLADDKHRALAARGASARESAAPHEQSRYMPQGEVEYLVEVCDPCEHSTYPIDGIPVSDFVTPSYYDTFERGGGHYSFMGRITHPRELLVGGVLSWRTADGTIYQALAEPTDESLIGRNDIGRVGDRPADLRDITIRALPGVTRQWSRQWPGTSRPGPVPRPPADGTYYPVEAASQRYGAELGRDVGEVVEWAKMAARQPPTIDEVIGLLRRLVSEDAFWASYSGDSGFRKKELDRLGLVPPGSAPAFPDRAQFERILRSLEEQERLAGLFGQDMFAPGFASWLCMLIS
jgi:hypothetical protein